MTAFIRVWADCVIAWRLNLLIATVVLLPLILLTGGEIPTDNSSERFFIAGDPAGADYDNLIELFGDNEYLVVGFEAKSAQRDMFDDRYTMRTI